MDDFEARAAQAEEKRKSDLHTELGRKDAVELDLYAKQSGLDVGDAKTAEDKRAAIELQAERLALAAISEARIKHMEEEQGKDVAGEEGKRDGVAKALIQLNALFCRDVPQAARTGSYKPEEGEAVLGGDFDVPNGKYRVAGSDWVFEIRKKKLVNAVQATASNQYGGKGVIPVA